jgi:hypothetical protein
MGKQSGALPQQPPALLVVCVRLARALAIAR